MRDCAPQLVFDFCALRNGLASAQVLDSSRSKNKSLDGQQAPVRQSLILKIYLNSGEKHVNRMPSAAGAFLEVTRRG